MQALAEVDADLEEARSRLDALNQARDLALRDAAEASAAIDTAKARAAQLVAAARQHREAAAVSERAGCVGDVGLGALRNRGKAPTGPVRAPGFA